MEATCSKCGETKPLDLFPKRSREGKVRTSSCKACRAAYMVAWKSASPERREYDRRKAKERAQKYPTESRRNNLKARFGPDMTLERYEEMLQRQRGVCAICKCEDANIDRRTGKNRRLAIDHCHETGTLRGLLCGDCNRSLGMMKEDIGALSRMISYIANHSTPERIAA